MPDVANSQRTIKSRTLLNLASLLTRKNVKNIFIIENQVWHEWVKLTLRKFLIAVFLYSFLSYVLHNESVIIFLSFVFFCENIGSKQFLKLFKFDRLSSEFDNVFAIFKNISILSMFCHVTSCTWKCTEFNILKYEPFFL